ncbi:hypothetical protein HMPREF3226_00164 [Prevotella corporis]|uniref:Uncharacterized protein n=1 Tax=Prevotella corporis TaxID=28128 RepID=A0A133QMZ4_9BACT|nr:hypothetical protein HMPREF3226_00164 [Prevotella corporis]
MDLSVSDIAFVKYFPISARHHCPITAPKVSYRKVKGQLWFVQS